MVKFPDNTRFIYPNLNPTERIPKVIKEYVYPELESLGFKILKSGLSIKRTVNDFQQVIWFSKSRWNIDNIICAFEPHFKLSSSRYSKWYKKEFGKKLNNDIIHFKSPSEIKGWNNSFFEHNDYDLAKHDNFEILEILNYNILNPGLNYLNTIVTVNGLIDTIKRENKLYLAPRLIDICLMKDEKYRLNEIINWFRDINKSREEPLPKKLIEEMEIRQSKLQKHFN